MFAPLRRWPRTATRPTRPIRRGTALRCEPLEDRSTPATLTITPTSLTAMVGATPHALTATGGPPAGLSTFATGLNFNQDMAFDAAGNLYVANQSGNDVVKITPQGAKSVYASGFSEPKGLAFDSHGNLFVSNQTADTISEVAAGGGTPTTFWSGYVNGNPTGTLGGVAVDHSDNVYVTVQSAGTIMKITPAGAASVFTGGVGPYPRGLAFGPNGNLYVSLEFSNFVLEVTPAGVVSPFVIGNQGLDGPAGMSFDSHGNLYVANYNNDTVSKVTPAGLVSPVITSGLSGVTDVVVDKNDNLYISNGYANSISFYGSATPTFSVDPADAAVLPSVGLALNADGSFSGTATAVPLSNPLTFHVTASDTAGDSGSATITLFVWDWNNLPNPLTWTGAGGTLAWSNANNWADAANQPATPADGSSLIFPTGAGAATVNDLTGLDLTAVYLKGSGYTVTGNPVSLTIGLGGLGQGGSGVNTYDLDTTLGLGGLSGGGEGVIDVMGGTLNVGGTVAAGSIGGGGYGLTVDPGATLAMGGFGGGGVGVIDLGPGSSASILGTVNVMPGGTLSLKTMDSGNKDVAVVGAGGALNVYGTAEVGWLGVLDVQGAANVFGGGSLTFDALDSTGAYGGAGGSVGAGGALNVSGTATVQAGGSVAFKGMDSGGHDVAIIEPGGSFIDNGTVAVAWNTAFDVYGTATVGTGGNFQMGDPAAWTNEPGNTLTVYGGGAFGIDPGGTVAMKGMDSGGRDVALVQSGGSFTDNGSALLGWNTTFDLYGTGSVGNGGVFQVGDMGFPGYVPGDPGASFTVYGGAAMDVGTGGSFQVGFKGMDSGGNDVAYVDAGGTFANGGTVDVQNGNTFTTDGTYYEYGSLLRVEDTSRFVVGPTGSATSHNIQLVEDGNLTVQGTLTVPPGGMITASGNASVDTSGAAAVNVQGATITWTSTATNPFPMPPPPPTSPLSPNLVVSGGPDGSAAVYVPDANGQYATTPTATIAPFPAFGGNVRTAQADVNGDGIPDTVLVTGPGTPIRVAVVSGADNSTVLVQPFDPFGGDFTGGGFVAGADLDRDGRAEFIVTPDQGGGPRVTIFSLNADGSVSTRANFFGIDDPAFRGGCRAAAGDVNGDGTPDIAVAAGFLGGPRTALFDGTSVFGAPTRLVNDFFAFPGSDAVNLRNGAYVAVGDMNGDGKADLIFGGGPGGAPRVFVLSGALVSAGNIDGAYTAPVANYFVAGNAADRGGVRVAAVDADGDKLADVAVGSGEGSAANVRMYCGNDFNSTAEPGQFQDLSVLSGQVMTGGVYVG